MSAEPPVTRAMLLAWMAGEIELSGAQIEAIPDELLAEQDAGLDSAFAALSADLAQPDSPPAQVDASWAAVQARIAPGATAPSPADLAPPAWRKALFGVSFLATAAILFFMLRPAPVGPIAPQDPYVKGAAAPAVEVEFLRHGDGEPVAITDGAIAQTARVIPQARLTEPAWLTWVHRGPDGAVQVRAFQAGISAAGQHVPQRDGEALAYSLRGEPGTHVFVVLASSGNPDIPTAKRWAFETAPVEVSVRRLTVEVR